MIAYNRSTSPFGFNLVFAGLMIGSGLAMPAGSSAAERSASDACAGAIAAPVCPALVRPQDQLWLVSDRRLGCSAVDNRATNLRYWRYQPDQGWQAATSAQFFAADDPAAVTHVWIHGNRITHSDAFRVGFTAYRSLAGQMSGSRPLRFVAWSWPSERIDAGQLADLRAKAQRTGNSAIHLAGFLAAIHPDVQVTLSAYSFGARIATGGLHLLAGGSLGGRRPVIETATARPRMNLVLIAAALDNDWILPGHCHGRALSMTDRLLLVDNGCDGVLERYHWLYGLRSCAEALGYTGLVGAGQLGAARSKIAQFDACCYVGPEHNWANYFAQPAVMALMAPYVLPSGQDTGAPAAASLPKQGVGSELADRAAEHQMAGDVPGPLLGTAAQP